MNIGFELIESRKMSFSLFEEQPFKVNELRNARIVEMKQQGFTYEQIAEAYGLSKQRPQQIIAEMERRNKLEQAFATIAAETRATNDLHKSRPVDYFLSALGFPKRGVSVLTWHYRKEGKQLISFNDLLELLLPREYLDDPVSFQPIPALRLKGLGRIVYADLVKRLGELDLGSAFAEEYRHRKAKLLRHLLERDQKFLFERMHNLDNDVLQARQINHEDMFKFNDELKDRHQ